MEVKIELKSCPFCGSEDVSFKQLFSGGKGYWSVECSGKCNIDFGMENTKEEAAALWNQRADEQESAENTSTKYSEKGNENMTIYSDYKVEKVSVWDDGKVLSEVRLRKVQNANSSPFAPNVVTIKSEDNGTWASLQLRDATIEIAFEGE